MGAPSNSRSRSELEVTWWAKDLEARRWRSWRRSSLVVLTPRGQAAGAPRRQLARPEFDASIGGCGGLGYLVEEGIASGGTGPKTSEVED